MLLRIQLLLLSTLLLLSLWPQAAPAEYQRIVDMEWDPIEGAKSYELELFSQSSSIECVAPCEPTVPSPLIQKTTLPAWTGPLTPGTYRMRIRSRDKRNVPGDWSTPEEFKVGLDPTEVLSPAVGVILKSQQTEKSEVVFKWKVVPGADLYHFTLKESESGDVLLEKDLVESQLTAEIPVANQYTWTVLPKNKANIQSENLAVGRFTLLGKKLDPVNIQKPTTDFVRQIQWEKSPKTETVDYILTRWNKTEKKWESVDSKKDFQTQDITFSSEWPGGRYRLVTRGKAYLRETSEKSEIQFTVFSGDRSPASEFTNTVRQSIDRTKGWYAIASYLVTSMSYNGQNYDQNTTIRYDAVGGTGRVGAGFLSPWSSWGGLAIIDYSGFTVGDQTFNFKSAEANVTYRPLTSERSEHRHYLGIFYKELPVILADSQGQFSNIDSVASTGPHYGYEFWYGLTPKFGFQLNAHLYWNLFKSRTPNDRRIEDSMSYQLGSLGSYRLNDTMTGLAGYAFRQDHVRYRSTNLNKDVNSVTVEGHYLNLFLEWSL